jgi:hypothetical protein
MQIISLELPKTPCAITLPTPGVAILRWEAEQDMCEWVISDESDYESWTEGALAMGFHLLVFLGPESDGGLCRHVYHRETGLGMVAQWEAF